MSPAEGLAAELNMTLKFFKNSMGVFDEADSGFAPQPEMFTVAAQVDHIAGTVDWFLEGAFGAGWDMNFDVHLAACRDATSLEASMSKLEASFAKAVEVVGGASQADLFAPIADTQIMDGAPRAAIVSAITDHTAHHRGALTVYARLLGKEPAMPYS